MQILAKFISTHVIHVDSCRVNNYQAAELKEDVCFRSGVPFELINVSINGKSIQDDEYLFDGICTQDFIVVNCSLAGGLKGGKGGFGARLKNLAKQQGLKRTTDFGSCRDLSGRRLRQVNDEVILQRWKEAQEKGEEFDVEESTGTGIDLWYLKTPNWADKFNDSYAKRNRKLKTKRNLCYDWCKARNLDPSTGDAITSSHKQPKTAQPYIPSNAPAWWGCPRGPRCEFAHGIEDLQNVVKEVWVDNKRRLQDEAKSMELDKYMYGSNNAEPNEEDDMMAAVAAGLMQASKRYKSLSSSSSNNSNNYNNNNTNVVENVTVTDTNSNAIAIDAAVDTDGNGIIEEDIIDSPVTTTSNIYPFLTCFAASAKAKAGLISDSSNNSNESIDSNIQFKVLQGADNIIKYSAKEVDTSTSNSDSSDGKAAEGTTELEVDNVGFVTTVVTGCPIKRYGSYYYEVELVTDGLIQVCIWLKI